jgi:hypothetical protein
MAQRRGRRGEEIGGGAEPGKRKRFNTEDTENHRGHGDRPDPVGAAPDTEGKRAEEERLNEETQSSQRREDGKRKRDERGKSRG